MDEAIDGLVTAIDAGRTDIVRSVVSTLENDDLYEEEDIKLDNVLNSLHTSAGTLLHYAAKGSQSDICRTLLASGADPGIHNSEGQTPLDIAASDKVCDVFKQQLLQATAKSDIGSMCQLIAAGVDVNVQDSPFSANIPLHWAASYGNKDTVHCLIKRGAHVNAMNTSSASPLHDAVTRGDLAVIEELLVGGADPGLAGTTGKYSGLSARTMAKDQAEVLELLSKYKDLQGVNGIADHNDSVQTILNSAPQDGPVTPLTPTTPNGVLRLNMENGNHTGPPSVSSSSLASPSLSAAVSHTSLVTVVTDARLHLLWPRPAKLTQRPGEPFMTAGGLLHVYTSDPRHKGLTHTIRETWQHHAAAFTALAVTVQLETQPAAGASLGQPSQPHLACQVNPDVFPRPQSYRLTVCREKIRLDASDIAGLHYGITTLLQLLRLCHQDGIPPLQIQDYPSVRDRGLLLDLSKGRVPTVASLKTIIELLAYLKINQLQLYTRFQVPSDPEVRWQFSYTRSTLSELDHHAASLGVTMIPVVDVLPQVTFDDLPDIYPSFEQYISCFTATTTLAVGPRLSSFLLDLSEDGRLLSDDSRRLIPVPPTHTLQLCAYLFHDATAALQDLPQNTVLAEYGFQANYDFAGHCQKYEESGVPFCVVPGTAAWNSLAGCPEAAVSNIHAAVQTAVSAGALGVVVSHWSGVGHMTHHPICLTGILSAAGMAWNSGVDLDFIHASLADLLNLHLLRDSAGITGQVILELGRAETYVLRCSRNQAASDNSKLPAEKGSTLYQLLSHPDDVSLEHLTPEIFQKSMRHIRKCQSELVKAQLRCPDAETILQELQLTADFMLCASRIGRSLVYAGKNPLATAGYKVINPGIANLVATAKTDLANRLLAQLEVYRSAWLQRNLPQGLSDSLLVFSGLLKQLIPDVKTPHKD